MQRARKVLGGFLWTLVLAAGCQDSTSQGRPCAGDADCPDDQVCVDGRCTQVSDTDGRDGHPDGDGGTKADRGDPGSWDAGRLQPCEGQADCTEPEICFGGFCVEVDPDPDCPEDDDDSCDDDSYCEPELDGCVPWEAHPDPQPRCEHIPPEGEFTPVEEWVWQNPSEAPGWDEVMMTPVVIDLTGQADPEFFVVPAVVFNSFNAESGYSRDGVLRAVRGGQDLICFNADGSFRWATDTGSLNIGWGGPAIANVDGEGLPEIVVGAAVLNADGTVRWQVSGSRGQNREGVGDPFTPFSVPADVDGDGKMEIVTGDTLYSHDGQVIWDTGFGDGFVAVAEFGTGGPPEIVVVRQGEVRVQSSIDGQIITHWTNLDLMQLPECVPDCGLLGPPTVADFDGDGVPEIGVAGSDVYIVLDTRGGAPLWSVATRDGSSNITGSAVFDFEGDHRAEVVYADEVSLKVFRGSDGTVLYEQPHSSLTACEYPVIADVDGDGNAEIVVAQNDLMSDAPEKFKGIRVFGDAADNWVTTRRIWNQHAYHVTNVAENGAIPVQAEKNWEIEGLNNFRQNVQPFGIFDAPDLTARGLGFDAAGCSTEGIVLYAAIYNRGHRMAPPGVPVAFYLGDPRAGGALLGVVRTAHPLQPGQAEVVAFCWADPPIDTFVDVYAVADDTGGGAEPTGEHSECREANNTGLIADVVCRQET